MSTSFSVRMRLNSVTAARSFTLAWHAFALTTRDTPLFPTRGQASIRHDSIAPFPAKFHSNSMNYVSKILSIMETCVYSYTNKQLHSELTLINLFFHEYVCLVTLIASASNLFISLFFIFLFQKLLSSISMLTHYLSGRKRGKILIVNKKSLIK